MVGQCQGFRHERFETGGKWTRHAEEPKRHPTRVQTFLSSLYDVFTEQAPTWLYKKVWT